MKLFTKGLIPEQQIKTVPFHIVYSLQLSNIHVYLCLLQKHDCSWVLIEFKVRCQPVEKSAFYGHLISKDKINAEIIHITGYILGENASYT